MAHFGFVIVILWESESAHGAAEIGFSAQVMNPQCFPKGASNPPDLNVNVLGSMASGTQEAVPGVLTRIKQLGGGSHLLRGRLTIRLHNGGRATAGGNKTCASFASGSSTVELVQNCRGPSDFNATAAHLAHEIGHIVGQNGYYGSYGRLPKCNVSRYGLNNDNKNPRNEEFAEAT